MVKSRCAVPRCVAWGHLTDRAIRRTVIKPRRKPRPGPAPCSYTHLYGIEPAHWEGEAEWVPARVVAFPITRATPGLIFYVRRDHGDQGTPEIGCVDRRRIEVYGDIYMSSRFRWEADTRLFLAPPSLDEHGPATALRPPARGTAAASTDTAAAA